MATTYIAAVDELFGIVKSVLIDTSAWSTLLGYNIDVRWPGVARGDEPDRLKLWARPSIQIVNDKQAALANADDEKLYEADGLLYVQLFCPRNQAATLENGRTIATAVQAAFRKQSPSSELWFRNPTMRELPESEDYYPINVVVQFNYRSISPAGASVESPMGLESITYTGAFDGANRDFFLDTNPRFLFVFYNGILQSVSGDYDRVGNHVTFVVAPVPNVDSDNLSFIGE